MSVFPVRMSQESDKICIPNVCRVVGGGSIGQSLTGGVCLFVCLLTCLNLTCRSGSPGQLIDFEANATDNATDNDDEEDNFAVNFKLLANQSQVVDDKAALFRHFLVNFHFFHPPTMSALSVFWFVFLSFSPERFRRII